MTDYNTKITVFWDVAPYSLIDISESDETSVNFYQTTWRNTPEDSRPTWETNSRSAGQ
jgi:hypothetical protein